MRLGVSEGIARVVPTHVGVNRCLWPGLPVSLSCPHARGGEPEGYCKACGLAYVVPTHVGVNRVLRERPCRRRGCPHARGGEPTFSMNGVPAVMLSPRTWG